MRENSDEKTRDTEEGVAAQKGFFPFLFAGFILVFIGIAIIATATVLQADNSVDFGAVILSDQFHLSLVLVLMLL